MCGAGTQRFEGAWEELAGIIKDYLREEPVKDAVRMTSLPGESAEKWFDEVCTELREKGKPARGLELMHGVRRKLANPRA